MSDIVLSILIPSTFDREEQLNKLLLSLSIQTVPIANKGKVEILTEIDNKETPTGTKRNILLQRSIGKYVVGIDSDDHVSINYVSHILEAAEMDCDAIGINGAMTTNGGPPIKWFISKDNGYCASKDAKGEEIYLRWNNHISPIKREIAIKFKFPDIYHGEDFIWSKQIHDSGLIKTETIINSPLYHYDYKTVGK